MSAAALYRAMGLNGYDVEDTWLGGDGALYVQVSVPRDTLRCRHRQCRCRHVHLNEHKQRFWKGAPLGLTPVYIGMRSPRVKCLSCGRKTWHQPAFAHGQRQVTKEFERSLEGWLSRLTIQDAVDTFGVSWGTVCDIDLRRQKKLPRPGLAGLQRLAIDENYLGKTHRYVTIVLDLDTKAIVSVTKGRGRAALKGFFSRLKRAGAKIKAVATDMAGGYIAAVLEHLPKAKLVFDPAVERTRHVIKLMNEKLTALRRDLYRELKDQLHRDVLKGIRWLLLMSRENVAQNAEAEDQARLNEALELNKPLATAYYLKEELRLFWKQPSRRAAEKFLEDWCRRANHSGIRQMQTMAKTLQAHRYGLLNWYDERISTGPLEGINNKIGALQRRAYGYRNYEQLKQRLLTLHHTKFILNG